MTATHAEPETWSRHRLWLVGFAVLAGQVALIFWLSALPPRAQPTPRKPYIAMADSPLAMPLGAQENPALLALPSWQGFSGNAWMQPYEPDFHLPAWSDENPPYLALDVQSLGQTLSAVVRTNVNAPAELVEHSPPDLDSFASRPTMVFTPTQSTLQLEGPLFELGLESPLDLPPQTASETILTASEVVVGVAADGRVFSSALVGSSGSPAADADALRIARSARFHALTGPLPETVASPALRLTWGRLIFKWLTVSPAPATVSNTGP